MTIVYVRWGGLLIAAMILAFLASQNYRQSLASLSPKEVLEALPQGEVRVLGRVKGRSLSGEVDEGHAQFSLAGNEDELAVTYNGPPPENLRELKQLVVIGIWNPEEQKFLAREFALVTNYGFVLSAYLIGLLPLAIFLFVMERKVALLYAEIKQSKLYESDVG